MMAVNMISDRCRGRAALLKTHAAERLELQLQRGAAPPVARTIEVLKLSHRFP